MKYTVLNLKRAGCLLLDSSQALQRHVVETVLQASYSSEAAGRFPFVCLPGMSYMI